MKSLSFDSVAHKWTTAASPPPKDLPRSRCCIGQIRSEPSAFFIGLQRAGFRVRVKRRRTAVASAEAASLRERRESRSDSCIATCSDTPARTRFRTAVRRRS